MVCTEFVLPDNVVQLCVASYGLGLMGVGVLLVAYGCGIGRRTNAQQSPPDPINMA